MSAPPAAHRVETGRGPMVRFGLASLGLWLGLLPPVIVSLQVRVEQLDPAGKENSLSLVLGVGALLGLIANPVCGRLSDRTTSRWGMRRPWLAGGAAAGILGLAVMAAAPNLVVLAVGWAVASIAYNALLAALMAVLPDQFPPRLRGTVSALFGVGQALASITGAGLAGGLSSNRVLMFLVPGVLAALLGFPLVWSLRDRRLSPQERPPADPGRFLRSFWINPRRHPDFGWAWLSRFLIFLSIASVLNYQVFFLKNRFGFTDDNVQSHVLAGVTVQTVIVLLSSNFVGHLSDRIGRRRIFVCVSAIIAAAGLVVLAYAHSQPQYLAAMALIGLGQGTYFAVDLALVADVLPNRTRDAAKDLGVMNIANTLPQSLAPAIAPVFISLGGGENYTALFVAGCFYAVLSGLAVLAVRGAC